MINFCTLFDSYYIHKGIALYLSLEKVTDDFHLYVMAFDEDCYKKLKSISFKNMTVELWNSYETEKFLKLKQERTKAEYCWTCGPSVIHHFLTVKNLPSITYLDSDMYFLGNPQIAFDEIGDNSVAITEQRISEEAAANYGRYCVQFLYFRNDTNGLEALTWWRESCINWCYQRFENDKYADQKYLDQFPIQFKNVHVMNNLGVGIAPWNMNKYTYSNNSLIANGIEYPCVLFHMHGLMCEFEGHSMTIRSFDYALSEEVKQIFFNSYAELIKNLLNSYFGKNIENSQILGQSKLKQIEYMIRSFVKKYKFFRWVYFSLMNKKHTGHGTKLN